MPSDLAVSRTIDRMTTMLVGRSPLLRKRWVRLFLALLPALVILSGVLFLTRHVRSSPAEIVYGDSDAYRFVANYFWHVPPDITNPYLRSYEEFPFRDIGVGTVYLSFVKVFGKGLAASVLPHATALLWAAALLSLYVVCLKRYGMAMAIVTLLLTALPLSLWDLHNFLQTEVYVRALLILGLCPLLLIRKDRFVPSALLTFLAILLAAHFKAQWMPIAFCVLVAMLTKTLVARQWRVSLTITVAALAVPLSLIAVHWIGWGWPSLTAGTGLHLAKTTKADFLTFACERKAFTGYTPSFCKQANKSAHPMRLVFMPDASHPSPGQTVRDLDAQVAPYLTSHPGLVLRRLWEGFRFLRVFPAPTRSSLESILATAPGTSPAHLLLNIFCILTLLYGLCKSETRFLAAYILGGWFIPVLGNVISWYNWRYNFPMSGLPLAGSLLILVHTHPTFRRWLARLDSLLPASVQ